MIRRDWREPNFRCCAIDRHGRRRSWLAVGASADDVRERIERRRWSDGRVEAYTFDEWRNRAQLAIALADRRRADDEAEPHRGGIWGELKQHLFELFDGKCAYCESRVQHVDHGTVDHYRPKGAVHGEPSHPGYHWLSHEPENLLPACGLCNETGKRTRFPVRDGTRAHRPADLAREQPLLLSPYRDAPQEHLRFLPRGDVAGITDRGDETIELCQLRRLEAQREAAQEQLETDLWIEAARERSFREVCLKRLDVLLEGEEEYSAALVDHLLHLLDEQERETAAGARAAHETLRGHRTLPPN